MSDAKTSDMPAGLTDLTFGTGRTMLQIDTMEKAWRLAKLRSVAKTVQPDFPEALTICILYGQEVGLTPLMAMEKIALINGRPTIWGDGALALVMTNPLFEDITEKIEGTGDQRTAYCTVKRQNQSPKTSTFSVVDAKLAGLWDERAKVTRTNRTTGAKFDAVNEAPWHRYPDRMLQMRARGFRLHDSFPDVLGGMYLREEFTGTTIEHEALEAPPEPPASRSPPPPPPPPHHVTGATITGGHHVEVVPPAPPPPPPNQSASTRLRPTLLVSSYMASLRRRRAEEDLDVLWGTLISQYIDADRLDDSVLSKLQELDDERRGELQQ